MEEKPRTTPYPLRMPEELREALETAATTGNRSLHSEIVARLQRTFDDPHPLPAYDQALRDVAQSGVLNQIREIDYKLFTLRLNESEHQLILEDLEDRISELEARHANQDDIAAAQLRHKRSQKLMDSIRRVILFWDSNKAELEEKLKQFTSALPAPPTRQARPEKIILVGNIGREPDLAPFVKPIPNKGPIKKVRGTPPK